jgi:CBS domain containing-hemolysin-like protein
LEKDTSIADARQVFLDSGHSRLPVYENNIDNIIGMAYVKDLLDVWHNGDTVAESVAEIVRPAQFVPETMTGDQLLRYFQKNKVHLVVVLEEYGGTGGLVTLEDLLEEIVGDIQDEYDEDENEEMIAVGEGEYRVDAGITLYDLEESLEIDLGDTDVDTLGGYIFQQLDRVPAEREVIVTDKLELKILSLEGRRIREVMVRILSPDNEDNDETVNTMAEVADEQPIEEGQ